MVIELVDKLLDDHVYSEIAGILNQKAIRAGGSARQGKADTRFTDLRVAYLTHQNGLRSRYDRLRDRGMLTKTEIAVRLGFCENTLNHDIGRCALMSIRMQQLEADPPRVLDLFERGVIVDA